MIDLLATDKSWYFAQPRPIIVEYSFNTWQNFHIKFSRRKKELSPFLSFYHFLISLRAFLYAMKSRNLSYYWQQNQKKLLEEFGPKTTFTFSNVCYTNGHTITWIPHMCWNISINFSNPWKILASPYTSALLLLFLPFMLIMMLVDESFTCQTTLLTELNTNLFSKKAVTLLFHIVINDSGNFLLPDFQAINVDIILDVLKGAPEPIHSSSEFFQPNAKLRLLSEQTKSCRINFSVYSYSQP